MDSPPSSKIPIYSIAYWIHPYQIPDLLVYNHCIPAHFWLAVILYLTPKGVVYRSAASEGGNKTVFPTSDFLREILHTVIIILLILCWAFICVCCCNYVKAGGEESITVVTFGSNFIQTFCYKLHGESGEQIVTIEFF